MKEQLLLMEETIETLKSSFDITYRTQNSISQCLCSQAAETAPYCHRGKDSEEKTPTEPWLILHQIKIT